jgi:hypothetical protein
LLSPENRVRVAVNELTLRDISNVIRRGLLILQPDLSYQRYQNDQGHYYGPYDPNVNSYQDADYAVNLCPDFDISNILLKDFDTVVGTQTISTNVNIGNVLVPKNINVFGNIISNGNIGVRTVEPLVSLDVSGSARFVGPLISTNYDTLRFYTNYGNSLINNLNQAPSGDYYQDAAISYDGQFQYGLLYDKLGVGNVNISRDYGVTWSQTALPSNYSGNIIYQAVPYMNGNVVTFPFSSLAANINLINAIPLNIQTGTYQASGTSFQSSYPYSSVFDNSQLTVWQTLSGTGYGYTNGVYVGSYSTTTINSPSTITGEYVQINLPYSFCLKNYQFYPLTPTSYNNYYPSTIYVCGSNDNSTWINLTPTGNNINIPIGANPGGNTYVSIPNTNNYNSYRFIVNSTINSGLSNIQTIISRIDLSGIFQNITGSFSSAMSASGTGQYITVANQGYYAGQGNLITSSDYGASFRDTGVKDTGAVWQSVAMSQTGNVQVAVSQNRLGFGNIFMSYNSGTSWSNVSSQRISNGWQTVSISSSGQYITAIAAIFTSSNRGNIWISSDYGASFSQPSGLTQIYNYIEPANGFLNLGMTDFNKTVCLSSSGQYQTALGLALSSQMTGDANIWISSNYGLNWRDTGAKAPFINGLVSVFTSITMNGSGQNQIATYMTGNILTGVRSQVSGNALVSSDYGSTWSNINYRIPSVSSTGNVYYGGVTKVQSSVNGQYVFGISKYQDISANTYTNTTNTAFGVGNVYLSSVPVTSGMFSTQYFGSAHTGNVFQTHGLELSVPNANNAALIAGYDVNWDAGYINSADQNGTNSLALNTTGGFVGIGKIAPTATLDVSGNAVISGGLTIGGITNFASNVSFNTISITSTVNSTSKTTGALTVAGGAGIEGNVFTGGNVFIGSTVNSTSKTTGALTVAGGAGFGGNLNVGGFSTHAFDASFNGNIQLTHTSNPLWLVSNNASAFNSTLASGNDVGIFYGTTNPASAGLVISPRGAGRGIKISTNGSLGIGVASPQAPLDITSSGQSTSTVIIQDANNGNLLRIIGNLSTGGYNLIAQSNDVGIIYGSVTSTPRTLVIAPHANATSGIRMDTNGYVGIGGANPGYALDVTGEIRATSNIFCRFNTANGFSALNSGDTGNPGYLAFHKPGGLRVGYIGWQATATYLTLQIENGYVGYECGGIMRATNFQVSGNGSLYWNSYSKGIQTTDQAAAPYGTISVIGSKGGWSGYDILSRYTFMASGNEVGIHDSVYSWCVRFVNGAGYFNQTVNAPSFNATSDYRMKKNIQPISKHRSIDLLKPVEYDLSGCSHDMGFLAHEVQQIFPFLVSGEKDGERMQSLNYNGFIALLVKEVQDLKKENRELKERMDRLEKYFM